SPPTGTPHALDGLYHHRLEPCYAARLLWRVCPQRGYGADARDGDGILVPGGTAVPALSAQISGAGKRRLRDHTGVCLGGSYGFCARGAALADPAACSWAGLDVCATQCGPVGHGLER